MGYFARMRNANEVEHPRVVSAGVSEVFRGPIISRSLLIDALLGHGSIGEARGRNTRSVF